jgi:prepilin-type N-terminal cleavage/methylation domain-containing protein/prepilin-type processing-associated H-X9-DG protein
MYSTHRNSKKNAGFTLVELLVVIGIIAVLISILLPTLSAARRQANNLKCQAALREIGTAFKQYAMNYKGYYPAARNTTPTNASLQNRRWTDMLAQYISKNGKNFTTAPDIATLRRNSVLWGCPEWAKTVDYDNTAGFTADNVYNGYAMQEYPLADDFFIAGSVLNLAAYITDSSSPPKIIRKGYLKETVWTRPPSADRLLVADSQIDLIEVGPQTFTSTPLTGIKFTPYDGVWAAIAGDPGRIGVDARHVSARVKKKNAINGPSCNALFCDGHVIAVSVRTAYNAIHNPGKDTTQP